jgi:hypothetical protein
MPFSFVTLEGYCTVRCTIWWNGVYTNALSRDADMRRRDVDARGDGGSFCHAEKMPLSMATQITQCYDCFRVAAVIPTMMPVVPVVLVKLGGWVLPVVVMIVACCCDFCCWLLLLACCCEVKKWGQLQEEKVSRGCHCVKNNCCRNLGASSGENKRNNNRKLKQSVSVRKIFLWNFFFESSGTRILDFETRKKRERLTCFNFQK